MIKPAMTLALVLLTACSSETAPNFGLKTNELTSGFEFISADSQALQQDDFSNPGYLWVEKGQALYKSDGCQDCHSDSNFAKSAASFPKVSNHSGQLINLQAQINHCRTERLEKDALSYESEDILGLVSYIKNLSLGEPLTYSVTPDLQPHFEAGKDYFYKRRGQFNLSCAQCHDENWGTQIRGDTISQGHINGFPTYRNDWQTLGSAHRRFRACNQGVRATQSELGSLEYKQLEVYLKARGSGLNNETPSIRR